MRRSSRHSIIIVTCQPCLVIQRSELLPIFLLLAKDRDGTQNLAQTRKEKKLLTRKKSLLANISTKVRKCLLRQNATRLCVNLWENAQYKTA